jgi:hypothetical protein
LTKKTTKTRRRGDKPYAVRDRETGQIVREHSQRVPLRHWCQYMNASVGAKRYTVEGPA